LEELLKMEVPIVEAASKYKQKTTEAPASVTIVTSDEVKKYGYRTLADILNSVPGLYLSYDRRYSFLGIRGFNGGDNSRVLLLVNGHRINNSLSDGAFIGNEFILDVDLIDRVEVIRGPGSSLYGNNAFFGVINVITRTGADMTGKGGEVSGQGGTFDTYKGRVTYGNKYQNGLELLLSGSFYTSEGQESLYYPQFDQRIHSTNFFARDNGVANNADGGEFQSFFGNASFHDFTLEGAYIHRAKTDPTAPDLADFNDPRQQDTDDRGYVDLKYAHSFEDIVDVTARVYYDRHDFNLITPVGGQLFEDVQVGEWWGTEVQFTKQLWDRLTLSLGGEYRSDFRQEASFLNAQTGQPTIPAVETNRQNYGVYLEGDYAVVTNLHLNAGFRYDQYGDFDPAFNPRVALIYNPIGQSVFKAIYGTAFRAPNFFELRHTVGLPHQDPVPETIATYELVYEQGIGNHLRSSVAGFYNKIDDLITFQNGIYTNLNNAEAKGVEVSLDGFWASGIRGRLSYSFADTEDTSTHEVLTDSPQHVAKANISVPLFKDKVFAGLEFQYVSQRTSTMFDFATIKQVPGSDAGGYGVLNFTLFTRELVKGLELSASVYNLLDRRYSDPATQTHIAHAQDLLEQDGRTFRVKLTYRF
jgi:iron complex outermembrane receptor protein